MIRKNKLALFLFAGLFFSQSIFATELLSDLFSSKQALLEYHDSGQYSKDIAQVTQKAIHYLDFKIAHPHTRRKPAIVFDIDETVLSNWTAIHEIDFSFPFGRLSKEVLLMDQTAIPQTFALYQKALRKHVAVFFITGRREKSRATTIQELHEAGYTQWTNLLLKPNNFNGPSAALFKASERKKIIDSGYDIIVNIGDQQSDLNGGYADRAFKLPNPYYYIN